MAHKSPTELLADVLVHLREVEFVLEELVRYLRPESWLSRTEDFPDVGAVLPIIADQISV